MTQQNSNVEPEPEPTSQFHGSECRNMEPEPELTSQFRNFGTAVPPKGGIHDGSVLCEKGASKARPISTRAKRTIQARAGTAKVPSSSTGSVIEFFHQCNPPRATAQQRRHTKRGTYMPPAVRKAKAILQAVFEQYAPSMPLSGPLEVRLVWTWSGKRDGWKTTRPDLDNLAKLALDAMTAAGYWDDDAQVAHLETAKFVGSISGIAVCVEQIDCMNIATRGCCTVKSEGSCHDDDEHN